MEKYTCRICEKENFNNSFIATDRLLGIKDEFVYFECSACKCVQIKEIPEDLGKYYPQEYYSFQEPVFPTKLNPFLFFLKKRLADHYIIRFNLIGWILSFFLEHPFPWLRKGMVNFNTRILDVGSGAGRKLLSMQRSGFKNITGIDPFNKEDIEYGKGLKIAKKDIFQVEEKYEFIMLHHSFEHMESPQAVLLKLYEILEDNGTILLRIPVANSYAYRKYESYWYSLDAPRHLYLHTTQSMLILAQNAGLKITRIDYDSVIAQMIYSEAYLRNLESTEGEKIFSQKEISHFQKEVRRLNSIHDGDCACFYLTKINRRK